MSQDGQNLDDDRDDTALILDYLSNRLSPNEVLELERRAKADRDFRYKLADLVMMKGLMMLALERKPPPLGAECRRARRMFPAYSRGKTSPAQTAELSQHLDECGACQDEFDVFEAGGEVYEEGWWARCRAFLSRLVAWRPWRGRGR